MNMNKILEDFIKKYFDTKLMPGIRENAGRLNKKYGSAFDGENTGTNYHVNSFGFQTSFMMRYMLMAFGAVCVVLLILSVSVNKEALEGVKIFGTFFLLCLILWIICKLKSGFIVYAREWIYIERPGKKSEFSLKDLKEVKVSGSLSLIFSQEKSSVPENSVKITVPLEGDQYEEFLNFLESEYPEIIRKIPENVYKKAMRKHGGSWGNRM